MLDFNLEVERLTPKQVWMKVGTYTDAMDFSGDFQTSSGQYTTPFLSTLASEIEVLLENRERWLKDGGLCSFEREMYLSEHKSLTPILANLKAELKHRTGA